MFVEAATCLGDSGQKSVLDHTTAHIDQRRAPPKREESSEKHSSNATPSAQIRLGVVKYMLLVNGLNTNIAACVLCDHRPTLTKTACFVEAAFFFTANWFKCKDRNWWVCFLVLVLGHGISAVYAITWSMKRAFRASTSLQRVTPRVWSEIHDHAFIVPTACDTGRVALFEV